MKKVPLNGKLGEGKYILVDDKDYALVDQYKWYIRKSGKNTYATRTIYLGFKEGKVSQTTQLVHRLIMSEPIGYDVDHKNGDGLDNQRDNLRVCEHHLNLQNRAANSNSVSQYKNIGKRGNRFTVRVSVQGSNMWLGVYNTLDEAITARDNYRNETLGEFA